MPTCLFPNVHPRRRIRQKFHYFEPIKFHERNPRKRTRSNPPSLVRSIRIPVASSHGDTRAVIKLKGFAISSLEYSIQKSRKRMHIERTGATTCPCSFRIRGYTNRMSNRESGSSNGENWSLCSTLIPAVLFRCSEISPLLGPSSPFPPIRKILDFSCYAVSAEIRGKHRG